LTLKEFGQVVGESINDKNNMKQELIKPGSIHNRSIFGNYKLRIRTTNFHVEENSAFILGAGIYGTSPLGPGIPTDVIDENFDQSLTAVGRGEVLSWLNGDAANEITHVDFGFGTVGFKTSDTEITALRSDCVAYWDFDQNPGGGAPQLTDQSPNTNNGTSGGTMIAGDEVAGKVGNGWDFDGVDDNVDIPASADLVFTDGFTLSLWAKPSTTGNMVMLDFNTGSERITVQMDSGGTTDKVTIEGSTATLEVTGTGWFVNGSWSHLVATIDRSGATDILTVYVNNVSKGTDSVADVGDLDFSAIAGGAGGFVLGTGVYGTDPLGPTDTGFKIGSLADATLNFQGILDEFGFWTRAIGTEEIATLYYAGDGRTYPFYTRGTLTSVVKTDGQVVMTFVVDGADYDAINFTEFGLFSAATDGVLYTRHVTSSTFDINDGFSGQIDVTLELDDVTPTTGIITTAGLNEVRDWIVGDAATAPTHIAWGTGTTNVAASDTTLEGEQQRNAIITSAIKNGLFVEFSALLATNEMIGDAVTKSGLFNAGAVGDMFVEQKFTAITKTDTDAFFDTETIKVI